MAPPSIAILGSRGIPASYGGFETFAEELSVRLVKHGIDVTVFCEGVEGPSSYHGVQLVSVPALNLGGLTTIIHDIRALWRARSKYDVVYMLGYGTSLFCMIPKLAGTQVWINMDGIEWQRDKWGFWGKTWCKIMEFMASLVPDLMVADSYAIKEFLRLRHRSLPEVAVIPYGADCTSSAPDPALLETWGLTPGEYHLMVGRFEPENHVKEIFQGFINSSSPYPLVALGTTRKPNAYRRSLSKIAEADERIILPGPIYDERVATLRYYARTYLHGHSVGGTNPSLLEAMGNGNAIIAHRNQFNREVVGDAAVYFTTAEEVRVSLEALDADDARRDALGVGALRRMKAKYTWDHVVDAYLSLLSAPACDRDEVNAILNYAASPDP